MRPDYVEAWARGRRTAELDAGGQAAGKTEQPPVSSAPPGEADTQTRLDGLRASALIHAHVYAAVWADTVREDPHSTTEHRATVANLAAETAASYYRPWADAS